MSKESDKAVHVLAQTPRSVREEIVQPVKTPEPAEQAASSPAEFPVDIAVPLARIEDTGQFIETCLERIHELETQVQQVESKQAETTAQLADAMQRNTEVEQALAFERERSARAEKLAAAVARRAKELELARSDAHEKLETLTRALEGRFRGLPELRSFVRVAA
jgi:predicted RNase H-like nuclease (RuvC/YqgF family)